MTRKTVRTKFSDDAVMDGPYVWRGSRRIHCYSASRLRTDGTIYMGIVPLCGIYIGWSPDDLQEGVRCANCVRARAKL